MLTSLATPSASASPGAASASAARDRRQAITVAGMMQKDDGDLDEDDFLWEKLPGRCCFYGYEDPKDASRCPPPSLAPSVGPPKLRMDDERRGGADDASRARRQLLD